MNYMLEALKEANKCAKSNDVPVGCVIVKNNKVIARGHNVREKNNNVFGHAEIEAIKKASKKLKDWQLVDCSIYITLEPCLMCAAAITQSHIKSVYIGTKNDKNGAFGGCFNILEDYNSNFKPLIMFENNADCKKIIETFFKKIRKKG